MYCQNHGIWKRRTQFHSVTYFVTLTKLLAFWVSLLYKMGSATTWFSRGCFESNISTDKVLYKAWYEPYTLISIHKWLSKSFSARWSRFHQSHQRASTETHNLGSLFTTWQSQDTSIFKEMHEMLELREERERKKKKNGKVFKSWCGIQGKEHELWCHLNLGLNFSTYDLQKAISPLSAHFLFYNMGTVVELWEVNNNVYKVYKYLL